MEELKFELGLKELQVNGGRIVRFNPSDEGFLETLFGMILKVQNILAEIEKKREKDNDLSKLFDYSRSREKQLREVVDSVFGENFCADVFADVRMLALADGMTVLENFLFAIIDKMNEDIRENLARRNSRVQHYTEKYLK